MAPCSRYYHDLRLPSDPGCVGFCSHDSRHQVISGSTFYWPLRTDWAWSRVLSSFAEGDIRVRWTEEAWRNVGGLTILPTLKYHLADCNVRSCLFKHCAWIERSRVDSG